jgi:hypothetical protein
MQTDFVQMFNVFEELHAMNGYSIKKTFEKNVLVGLELNSGGRRYIFDPQTLEMTDARSY